MVLTRSVDFRQPIWMRLGIIVQENDQVSAPLSISRNISPGETPVIRQRQCVYFWKVLSNIFDRAVLRTIVDQDRLEISERLPPQSRKAFLQKVFSVPVHNNDADLRHEDEYQHVVPMIPLQVPKQMLADSSA